MLDRTPIRQISSCQIDKKRGDVGRTDVRIPHRKSQLIYGIRWRGDRELTDHGRSYRLGPPIQQAQLLRICGTCPLYAAVCCVFRFPNQRVIPGADTAI